MKKRKVSVFWIGLACFTLIYVSIWLFIFAYVNKCLILYEAAQPERVMERLVDSIKREGLERIFSFEAAPTRFETQDTIVDYYAAKMQDKEITWQQNRTGFDPHSPSYQIYAGEELLGSVTLHATSTEPLMSILTISEWAVGAAELIPVEASESVTVTVPESYCVLVNGVPLEESELTGEATVSDLFKYAKEYVTVPQMVEYQVQGLIAKPVVEIRDAEGDILSHEDNYEAGQTSIELETFPVAEMDGALEEMVLDNAKRYSNFFSRDLPGCQESTKPIADMFPKDSYYLKQAETYRRFDMWMYSGHYAPTFENEKVTEYTRYSDDLFSCVVYFDKIIHLSKVDVTRVDTTHTRFFYGLLGGEWKILDMQTLLEE